MDRNDFMKIVNEDNWQVSGIGDPWHNIVSVEDTGAEFVIRIVGEELRYPAGHVLISEKSGSPNISNIEVSVYKGHWAKPKFDHKLIFRNPVLEALNWQIAEDTKRECAEQLAEEERIREEEYLEHKRQEEERLQLRHGERQDLLDSQAVLLQDAKVSSMSIDYEFWGSGMFVIEFDNGHKLYFCSNSYEALQFAGSDFYSPGVTHSDELHDCDEIK